MMVLGGRAEIIPLEVGRVCALGSEPGVAHAHEKLSRTTFPGLLKLK